MNQIGTYRMKLYDLLYTRPICDHMHDGQVSVLILGSGWVGSEAWKAVFWAGQYVGCRLSLTIASRNAGAFETALYQALPALSQDDCSAFAALRFCSVSNLTGEDALQELVDASDCDYVIISLGDPAVGEKAAEALVRIRTETKRTYAIHLYDSRPQPQSDTCGFFRFGAPLGDTHEELKRMARNIDYSYQMAYQANASKAASYDAFHAKYLKLVGTRADTDDPSRIVQFFTGRDYDIDSSFSCAVHIPYKLHLCRTYAAAHDIEKDAYAVLTDAIRTKNELYCQLMTMEHRRWMAFMATYGYYYPSEEEQEQLYIEKNDHRSKESGKPLWHMCMCACGENGLYLDKHPGLWNKDPTPEEAARLSPLDRAGLLCHRVAVDRAKEKANAYMDEKSPEMAALKALGDEAVYADLRQSIKKLCADDDNSVVLYQNALAAAKQAAGAHATLQTVEKDLKLVVTRNSRMDFFENDAQLLDMLPFCLWYGAKYQTVITVSAGDAAQDIIAPTLLCADRAVYLTDASVRDAYTPRVTAFFKQRGNNTVCDVRTVDTSSVDAVSAAIDAVIAETGITRSVFAVVPHHDPVQMVAAGAAVQRHPYLETVSYRPGTGLFSLRGNALICAERSHKSVSAAEYLALKGARYQNLYSVVERDRYACLHELYSTYNGGKNKKSIWFDLIGRIKQKMVGNSPIGKDAAGSTRQKEINYSQTFPHDVFTNCGLEDLLSALQRYHIIDKYTHTVNADKVYVQCTLYEKALQTYLDGYAASNAGTDRIVTFSPAGGIREQSLSGTIPVTDTDGDTLRNFLNKLSSAEFLAVLPPKKENGIRLRFRDLKSLSLFQREGNGFEYLVYYELRHTGLFDDVEIGFEFRWNAQSGDLAACIREQMGDRRGYNAYQEVRETVSSALGTLADCKNEIDVVATKGMTAYFISCKDRANLDNSWLTEIAYLAGRFGCRPILAVSQKLSGENTGRFQSRAKQMGVALIDSETLLDREKLKAAVETIIRGEV